MYIKFSAGQNHLCGADQRVKFRTMCRAFGWAERVVRICVCMLSHFSHVRLLDPIGCSPSGFSAHGILQARILDWVAMPPPTQGLNPHLFCPCIGRWVLYHLCHLGSHVWWKIMKAGGLDKFV